MPQNYVFPSVAPVTKMSPHLIFFFSPSPDGSKLLSTHTFQINKDLCVIIVQIYNFFNCTPFAFL